MSFSVTRGFSINSLLIFMVYYIAAESQANVWPAADSYDWYNDYSDYDPGNTSKYPLSNTTSDEQDFELYNSTDSPSWEFTETTTATTELPCAYAPSRTQFFGPKKVINSAIYTEAVLDCAVGGDTPEHIRWYKDGTPVLFDSNKFAYKTLGKTTFLMVTPQTDDDFGLYTCEVEQRCDKYNESIMLVAQPVVETLTLEDVIAFRWRVTSHLPLHKIEMDIKITSETHRQTVQIPIPEVNNHTYEIEYNLNKEKYLPGYYMATIRAMNAAGWSDVHDSQQTSYVDFAPVVIQTPSASVSSVIPKKNYWTDMKHEGNLHFGSNTERSSTERYFSKFGIPKTLNPCDYGPRRDRIYGPKKEINSAPNAKAVLDCVADEETPDYFRWFKDNLPIFDNSEKLRIDTSERTSILEITPQTDYDFGIYTCEIGYRCHPYTESTKLVEYPVVDTLTPEKETTFRWRVISHLPLKQIAMEILEITKGEPRQVKLPIPKGSNHTYEVEYNLDKENYQPGNYSAFLRARNDAGWSSGQESRLFTTVELEFLGGDAGRPVTTVFTVLCLYVFTRIF